MRMYSCTVWGYQGKKSVYHTNAAIKNHTDAPPYHGIRGQGRATLSRLGSAPTLDELLARYVGGVNSGFAKWLLSRREEELLIEITPHRMFSWDYRDRMAEL